MGDRNERTGQRVAGQMSRESTSRTAEVGGKGKRVKVESGSRVARGKHRAARGGGGSAKRAYRASVCCIVGQAVWNLAYKIRRANTGRIYLLTCKGVSTSLRCTLKIHTLLSYLLRVSYLTFSQTGPDVCRSPAWRRKKSTRLFSHMRGCYVCYNYL